MADYEHKNILDLTYAVPVGQKPRKKAPPLVVVMNENCNSCAGSPVCQSECPVDCIHMIYDDESRPMRVYIDNTVCIGCMNCFSYSIRPKNIIKGDKSENCERYNEMDLMQKEGVCPWDAIEILPFDEGVSRSNEFYYQPAEVPEGFTLEPEEPAEEPAAGSFANDQPEIHAMSDGVDAHHGPSYLTIFSLLIVFTVVTVGVAQIDFGTLGGVVIALTVATLKAALVALFFMHLKSEVKPIKVVIGVPLILMVVMFTVLLFERF